MKAEYIPIEVLTSDLSDDEEQPARKIVNHANHSDRVWLGSHIYWALRNGKGVAVRPFTEDN